MAALTPADIKAILHHYDDEMSTQEIAGLLGLPVLEVRRIVAENRHPAGRRDQAVPALVEAAARSPKQKTRNLGERLKAAYTELRAALDDEALAREEAARKAEKRRNVLERIDRLQADLAAARAELKAMTP